MMTKEYEVAYMEELWRYFPVRAEENEMKENKSVKIKRFKPRS
jgi:hypothetical protein